MVGFEFPHDAMVVIGEAPSCIGEFGKFELLGDISAVVVVASYDKPDVKVVKGTRRDISQVELSEEYGDQQT